MTRADDVRRSTEGVSRRTQRLCAAVAALVVVAAVPTFFVDGILNGTPVMNGSARGTPTAPPATACRHSLLATRPVPSDGLREGRSEERDVRDLSP